MAEDSPAAFLSQPAVVYLSTNGGQDFTDITSRLASGIFINSNGMQKNPGQDDHVFILAEGENIGSTNLFVSTDGADTFQKHVMPFNFNGQLDYHPTDANLMMAFDYLSMNLYLTRDLGASWKLIKQSVVSQRWADNAGHNEAVIYCATTTGFYYFSSGDTNLERSTDGGENWEVIHKDIVTFGTQGQFLFASVRDPLHDSERFMEVSTDKGNTWAEVQLPSITDDRFYSILDATEEQVFMHVDDPGDTGVGKLYSSDQDGIIFTESLDRHLYPNFDELTDFYKVLSLRGVYLSSQLKDDMSIRTMITFDRGGEWRPIKRPEGARCEDENKECYLQIHHMYSASRGISSNPPKSVRSAIGIILVHGHVASSLKTSPPDVFVSSDGGYTWRFALEGPHHYEIADQGGLIVAVPADTSTPDTLKFSTDEGRCWQSYKFTEERIVFTGLLTEPGNKAMAVALWGYGEDDKQWRVQTINFDKVIDRVCASSDYQEWTAHWDNGNDGCLLGIKETYQRLNPDSWCLNGHARDVVTEGQGKQICKCTKADYDCDYGYVRDNSENCVKDESFKEIKRFSICKRNHVEELFYKGYQKIPGDQCQGGFQPPTDTVIQLKTLCEEGDKSLVAEEEGIHLPNQQEDMIKNHRKVGVLVTLCIIAFLAVVVLIAFLVKKYKNLRRSKIIYHYSSINSDPNDADELERALAINTSLYEDSSDDDLPSASEPSRNHSSNQSQEPSQPVATGRPQGDFRSYHDDSDEDMLM